MNITEECNSLFLLQKEYLEENKEVNKITPLVSVSVATYQHVDFIKECLDGILMQITNFPIEIIVGEDESNDGTREICIEYADKYPDKVRLFLRDRKLSQLSDEQGNFLTRFNGIWNRMSCRGKYIAICEGDDYWIDQYKLQKQVDFLESNYDVNMVFSNRMIQENGTFTPIIYPNRNFDLNDVLSGNNWGIQSVCFRKAVLNNDRFFELIIKINADRLIPYLCATKGKIRRIKEFTSVYRMTGNGIATSRKKEKYIEIAMDDFWRFHETLNFPNQRMLTKGQARYISSLLIRNKFNLQNYFNQSIAYLSKYEKVTLSKMLWINFYVLIIMKDKVIAKFMRMFYYKKTQKIILEISKDELL
jgi:glycosyltransferase involved in cell wall biosynthesis